MPTRRTPAVTAASGERMEIWQAQLKVEDTVDDLVDGVGGLGRSTMSSDIMQMFADREDMFDEMFDVLKGVGAENKVLKKKLRTMEEELHELQDFVKKTGLALVAQIQVQSQKEEEGR